MKSVEYECGLLDQEMKNGMPPEGIILGRFSQHCATSVLVGLSSRRGGELGGIVGLSGHLPLSGKVRKSLEGRDRPIEA